MFVGFVIEGNGCRVKGLGQLAGGLGMAGEGWCERSGCRGKMMILKRVWNGDWEGNLTSLYFLLLVP